MKLGRTDLVQNVNVRILGGTVWINSVGPMSLGLGHNVILVRTILVIVKQRVGQANSVGVIAHFGETEMLQREIECLQGHLSETEIHIGETELLVFLVVAMSYELGGSG